LKGSKREGTEDSLETCKRLHELNYLWGHLEKEGRRAWLIEARGIYRLQIINRVFHVLLLSVLIITVVLFFIPWNINHYPFIAAICYITAINIFITRYKINKKLYRRR